MLVVLEVVALLGAIIIPLAYQANKAESRRAAK
ncbi:MAG: hypothetical protein JWR23_182 [Mucilaginibacter sp.]|nr:hypothetical protein [Mucilaginibacter sp.]MDB5030245.1 hypothetical protein [Mucilaginibacter sp.]